MIVLDGLLPDISCSVKNLDKIALPDGIGWGGPAVICRPPNSKGLPGGICWRMIVKAIAEGVARVHILPIHRARRSQYLKQEKNGFLDVTTVLPI